MEVNYKVQASQATYCMNCTYLTKELNLSLAGPNPTSRGSCANQGYGLSKFFHASVSAGCLKMPSSPTCFSWCHFISFAVYRDPNSYCNQGFKGK